MWSRPKFLLPRQVSSGEKKNSQEADNAFAMYHGFLWILGVWPLEERSAFQTFRYVVAAVAQASFLLHTGSEIYQNNGEISDVVDLWLFFASALLTLTKHTYLHLYRDKIAENMRLYSRDWSDTKDEGRLKIMRDHFKIYKYQMIVYNSCGYTGTTLFALRTILVNYLNKRQTEPDADFEYQFVCQTSYLPADVLSRYYEVILLLQYVQLLYCCTSGAVTDCFFFGLLIHLGGQLQILKNDWKSLGARRDERSTLENSCQRKKTVDRLIDRHKELFRLGENMEESFNRVVLVQLMISVILICMSGCSILVSLTTSDYMTMLISTNCIMFMITESFVYGYPSDYLMLQSESIVQAVYSSSWYELDTSLKKNIIFVMMRAQIPLHITAGKFFYVTRNSIIQMLKTSASYLSVLRLTLEANNVQAVG